MLRPVFLLLVCTFSIAVPHYLQGHYRSAHAIVVNDFDNSVLFGLTKKKELSTYGGLRDPGERDPKFTAARETNEESLAVLGTTLALRVLFEGVTTSSGGDKNPNYVIHSNFGNPTLLSAQFKQLRFPGNNLSRCQKENIDIVAISLNQIVQKVMQGGKLRLEDSQGNSYALRSGSENAIKAAVRNGKLEAVAVIANN